MSLPQSRTVTYIPGSLPSISAASLNEIQDAIVTTYASLGRAIGDGIDGAVSLVYGGIPPAGMSATIVGGVSIYTLTRDLYPASLTVGANCRLVTNGWRVYCRGQTWVQTGAWISQDGNAATGSTAGAVLASSGTLLGGGSGGGNGTTSTGLGASSSLTNGFGGAGVTASGRWGAGGTPVQPPASLGSFRAMPSALSGYLTGLSSGVATLYATVGGMGSGGGGSPDGTGAGGGGGGGGGVLLLAAAALVVDGVISANGGAGGNGSGTNSDGGNGGGGGTCIIVYGSKTGAGTITAGGGAGGTKAGTGLNGSAGNPGSVFLIPLFS